MSISLTIKDFDYIIEADLKLKISEQTTFHLTPLSAQQFADVNEIKKPMTVSKKSDEEVEISSMPTEQLNPYLFIIKVLEYGLKGWTNFPDAEGNETTFVKDNAIENINRIPALIRSELVGEIVERSSLSKAQVKN